MKKLLSAILCLFVTLSLAGCMKIDAAGITGYGDKIIHYNEKKNSYDDRYISDDLLAQSADEIGGVVTSVKDSQTVTITLTDAFDDSVLGEKRFENSSDKEIAAWVEKLWTGNLYFHSLKGRSDADENNAKGYMTRRTDENGRYYWGTEDIREQYRCDSISSAAGFFDVVAIDGGFVCTAYLGNEQFLSTRIDGDNDYLQYRLIDYCEEMNVAQETCKIMKNYDPSNVTGYAAVGYNSDAGCYTSQCVYTYDGNLAEKPEDARVIVRYTVGTTEVPSEDGDTTNIYETLYAAIELAGDSKPVAKYVQGWYTGDKSTYENTTCSSYIYSDEADAKKTCKNYYYIDNTTGKTVFPVKWLSVPYEIEKIVDDILFNCQIGDLIEQGLANGAGYVFYDQESDRYHCSKYDVFESVGGGIGNEMRFLTSDAEDVGGIIITESAFTEKSANYSGDGKIYSYDFNLETLKVSILNANDGRVIATKTFQTQVPNSILGNWLNGWPICAVDNLDVFEWIDSSWENYLATK